MEILDFDISNPNSIFGSMYNSEPVEMDIRDIAKNMIEENNKVDVDTNKYAPVPELNRYYDGYRTMHQDIMGNYMLCDANILPAKDLGNLETKLTIIKEIDSKVSDICGWDDSKDFIDEYGLKNKYLKLIPFRYIPADVYAEEFSGNYESIKWKYDITPETFNIDITEYPSDDLMDNRYDQLEWYEPVKVHLIFCDFDGEVVGESNDYGYHVIYHGPKEAPNNNNPHYDEWAYCEVQTLLRSFDGTIKEFRKSEVFHNFIQRNCIEGKDVGYFQKLVDTIPETLYIEKEVELLDIGNPDNISNIETYKEIPSYIEYGFRSEEDMRYNDYKTLTGTESKAKVKKLGGGAFSADIAKRLADQSLKYMNELEGKSEENNNFDINNFGPVRGNVTEVIEKPKTSSYFEPMNDSPFDKFDEDGEFILGETLVTETIPNRRIGRPGPIFGDREEDIPNELVYTEKMHIRDLVEKINDEEYAGANVITVKHFSKKHVKKMQKKLKKKNKKIKFNDINGEELSDFDMTNINSTNRRNALDNLPLDPDSVKRREELKEICFKEWEDARITMDDFIDNCANEYVSIIFGEPTGDIITDANREDEIIKYKHKIYSGDRQSLRLESRGLDRTSQYMRYYSGANYKRNTDSIEILKVIDKYDWYLRKYTSSPEDYYSKMVIFDNHGILNLMGGGASEMLGNMILSPGLFASNPALAKLMAMQDSQNEMGESLVSVDQVSYLQNLLHSTYDEPNSESIQADIMDDVGSILGHYGDVVENLSGSSFDNVLQQFADGYGNRSGNIPDDESYMQTLKGQMSEKGMIITND